MVTFAAAEISPVFSRVRFAKEIISCFLGKSAGNPSHVFASLLLKFNKPLAAFLFSGNTSTGHGFCGVPNGVRGLVGVTSLLIWLKIYSIVDTSFRRFCWIETKKTKKVQLSEDTGKCKRKDFRKKEKKMIMIKNE